MAQRRNRQIVLRQRPNGLVAPADVELIDTTLQDILGDALRQPVDDLRGT